MASYRDFLPVVSDGEWVRPSDWLALPTVTVAEEKFVGLHAVFPEGNNFCALLFRGAYTVDWGDGVVENVADNVKAEHEYDYSAISNATLTSRGYKQVIVTVTPQVGQNLTTINFQQRYTGQNQPYATGWLDVTGSFPSASSITFGGTTIRHGYVERVTWLTIGGATSMDQMFSQCRSLQSVPLFDTTSVGVMQNMFQNCASLRSVPLFNTASVTNMNTVFTGCVSIRFVPLFNTASATTMTQMFFGCTSLQSVPLFNTASAKSMFQMFVGCNSLQSVPLFNTASVTSMADIFNGCISLNALPALSTASITTTAGSNFGLNFANACNSLDRCQMVFARTVGFAFCQLGVDALVEIFTNLVDRSATTSATITITNNWGAALLTAGQRAIATDKNWAITG